MARYFTGAEAKPSYLECDIDVALLNGNVLLRSNNNIVLLTVVNHMFLTVINHMCLQSLVHSIMLQTVRDTTDTNSNIVKLELCADATTMSPAQIGGDEYL